MPKCVSIHWIDTGLSLSYFQNTAVIVVFALLILKLKRPRVLQQLDISTTNA